MTIEAFKVGDIIRVIKRGPHVDVRGEVGFIDELAVVQGIPYAQIQLLRIDGSMSASGGIPVDCLVRENAPAWAEAKKKYEAYVERLRQEGLDRGRRWKALVARVAAKHGIDPEVAEKMHAEIEEEWG
jgi:hypothetical protein